MSGWTTHTGLAVVLDRENIDTDQLIPARFMSTPRSDGYGDFLLHDLRTDANGQRDPAFPLNAVPRASILIAGRNFGSGSSREAAVYALVDFGIRAVIAPSFGDIFASNAVNNGLLPARVDEAALNPVIRTISANGTIASIDLVASQVTIGDVVLDLTLDEVWRQKLINGWDDIDLTQQHIKAISAYRETRARVVPWAFSSQQNDFKSAGRETGSQ